VVSVTSQPPFTLGKDPVPIAQETGWAPAPVSTNAENLAPPGFDPRTVQPVASRYTDNAIGLKFLKGYYFLNSIKLFACLLEKRFIFCDFEAEVTYII